MVKLRGYGNYSYPDIDDRKTTILIRKVEPYPGYWKKSEEYILDIMEKYIQDYITDYQGDVWLLDAGCGTGRLLFKFEKYFDFIVGIDPDPSRLSKARKMTKDKGLVSKIFLKQKAIENFEWKHAFDVILCSHVLQHVNTNSVPVILSKLRQLLKIGGLIFLMTCHSGKGYDTYVKAYLKEHELIEESINKDEFNSLIFNDKDILPIHFFSKKTLFELLSESRFKVLDYKVFHIVKKIPFIDRITFRDKVVNLLPPLRSRLGRDIFIVGRGV